MASTETGQSVENDDIPKDQIASAKDHVSDDTEDQLGISEYLSADHDGFSGVLKARYSDFVVHEVGVDGKVARLDSMSSEILFEATTAATTSKTKEEAPDGGDAEMKDADATRKRKREEQDETNNNDKTLVPEWASLEAEFGMIVDGVSAQKVIQFLRDDFTKAADESQSRPEEEGEDNETQQQFFVALPPIKDKEIRKKIHQWTKSSTLAPIVTADTADDEEGNKVIRFWPLRHEKKMPNYGKFNRSGRRIPKQGHRGKEKKPTGYLQFVLYKENCDTNTAVKQITQRMGGRGGRGRGRGGRQKVRAGYAGMKDKRGVTTQFMTLYQRSPHEISWVNQNQSSYYGGGNSSSGGVALIRVGNFCETKEELRLGRLKGNRFDVVLRNVQTSTEHSIDTTKDIVSRSAEALQKHGFINYFGTQRFGRFHDTHLAGMAFLKGDFATVVELIMRPKEGERQNVHDARQEWERRFDNLTDEDSKDARAKAEAECAKVVLRSMGRFMANEVSILETLSRYPLDYKRAFSSINKTMKMMFMHAVQSHLWNKVASYRIKEMGHRVAVGDLVFVNGSTEQNNDSKSPSAVKHVTQEDIDTEKYTLEDVLCPLLGAKSVKPDNESGKLFAPLLKECGLTADVFENILDRDLTCPGDYRKLICRPTDVDFSVVQYHDPFQPLLQTDLMKINGVPVLSENPQAEGGGSKKRNDARPILGLVVGFTLPSSAYATIALRELMKKPTSSEYQKELGLGGSATGTT